MDVIKIITFCMLLVPSTLFAQEKMKYIEMLPGDNLEQKLLENGINLDPPLSQEEIDISVNNFIEAVNFAPVSSLSEGKTLSWDESKKIEDYTRGDSYVVSLDFNTGKRYPKKYPSQNHFVDNPSSEFFDKMCNEIFTSVIGTNYPKYEPVLNGSNAGVSIKAIFRDEADLRALLSLPNLIAHYHFGTPITYEEVLPLGHN